jgi:integrase
MASIINEKSIAALPAPARGNKVYWCGGATLQGKKAPSGFGVRVTAAGYRSFVWEHRIAGRAHRETIGTWVGNTGGGEYTVLQGIIAARHRADEINRPGSVADPLPARTRSIKDGRQPIGKTVANVLDEHLKLYVDKKLRSAQAIRSIFARLVTPVIGALEINKLRRSHIADMLDKIAEDNGEVAADRTLQHLSKALNWHALRDDDFRTPIVKGMRRTSPKDHARKRKLDDDEIRDLFAALDHVEKPTCYPRYVKFLLYTATRLSEAAEMRWDEVDLAKREWVIPAARYKTKIDHLIPLTPTMLDLIGERPKDIAALPYVFSPNGGSKPLTNHQQAEQALHKAITEVRNDRGPMPHWVKHDLRRTARSLMSRAGISSDHAERCLGHVIAGVQGTYDRHDYLAEKRHAFEALDAQINRILNPVNIVTPLRKAEG